MMPKRRDEDCTTTMSNYSEYNFDGLIGPTHNYAGAAHLSPSGRGRIYSVNPGEGEEAELTAGVIFPLIGPSGHFSPVGRR